MHCLGACPLGGLCVRYFLSVAISMHISCAAPTHCLQRGLAVKGTTMKLLERPQVQVV